MQYYTITNDISEEIWKHVVSKFRTSESVEMTEYFGTYLDDKCRKLSNKRILKPKVYFNTILPEYSSISMRPQFEKWDSFSFIQTYRLSLDLHDYLEENWNSLEIETFNIIDEESKIVFSYNPLQAPIILLGNGELEWAKSIGLRIVKHDILLNDTIG